MDNKKTVSNIAETILGELENFGSKHEIRTPPRSDVFATAGGNIADATDPNARLGQIQATVLFSQAILKRGPFNAYVRAIIDDSREKIYFICRGYTPLGLRPSTPNSDFVNYLSPMGRIVELEPGNDDYFSLPGGDVYIEVKEKNIFRPIKLNELWDGIDNSIYLETGTFSIESLVGYLKALGLTPEEIIRLEYDEKRKYEEQLKIRIGIRRKIIDKIELRDQPILDKSQGEIFRNPLSSQLIITGAPGTGKTTLLIKRIAQKSDHKNLEDFEKAGLNDQDLDLFFNKKNWVLFTPTELLKMFLKEAFNKEWLPASDELVKVWDDERNLLGREFLRFMKVGDRGYFRKTDTQLLWDISNKALIEFASNFFSFFYNQIYDEILGLKKVSMIFLLSKELEILCRNIFKKIEEMKSQPIEEVVFALIEFLSQHRNISLEIENYLNNEIESMANAIIGDNPTLIGQILSEIEMNKQFSEESVFEDEEEDQAESEIEPPTGQESITAKRRLKKVIRSYSINLFKQRSFSKNTLQFKILELITDRLPKQENLERIGQQIVESRLLANITTGYRIILRRVPYYYQRYRLEILSDSAKYLNKDFEIEIRNKKISDHEMDLIIYFILKNAKKVFDNHPEYLHTDTKNDILENIKNKYATLIAVDEATDFSSLQLGCMFYLAHPQFCSVSMAGDLMQRVTSYGVTDWNECKFISNKFEVVSVSTVYRQSSKLLEIARKLYEKNIVGEAPFKSGFEREESDPDPLIFRSKGDDAYLGGWIADRIVEIYKINNNLPSIAIFVIDDTEIDSIVQSLKKPLAENSIGVKGCPGGEVLGSDGKVRVFSIRYIKGLEFESVFFINIDDIFVKSPNLIDKYLYVGLTRAASFLALTVKEKFPTKIDYIEKFFKEETWGSIIN